MHFSLNQYVSKIHVYIHTPVVICGFGTSPFAFYTVEKAFQITLTKKVKLCSVQSKQHGTVFQILDPGSHPDHILEAARTTPRPPFPHLRKSGSVNVSFTFTFYSGVPRIYQYRHWELVTCEAIDSIVYLFRHILIYFYISYIKAL